MRVKQDKAKSPLVKKGIYNIFTSLFYKLLVCVVGIIIPRFFILEYGSELNGLQSSVSQIFTYIALLEAGVGAATLQALFAPVSGKNHKEANGILSATTVYYNRIGCIYFGVLVAVSLLYPLFVKVSTMDYFMVFLYIVVSGATTGINFFYKAKILLVMSAVGDNHVDSLINTGVFALSSVAKILLILNGFNIILIQAVYLLINVLATVLYYIIAKKKYPWLNFHETPNLKSIEQKNFALVHKISSIIFQNVDVLLLTFIADLQLVSIYTMYKMVINMVSSIVGSLGDSINFIIGQSFNGENVEEFKLKIDTFNVYYSALSFALYCATYILIIPFLKLYTSGMDINYIIYGLPFLYVLIEVLQVGREAMIRTINVAGRFKETIYSTVIETGLNVVVSIVAMLVLKNVLGESYMLYGALLGTIIALTYRTFDINYFANRKILGRSAWCSNKMIVTNIGFFGVVVLFENLYTLNISNYVEFFFIGGVITVVMVALEMVIQSLMNPKAFTYLVSHIRKKGDKK